MKALLQKNSARDFKMGFLSSKDKKNGVVYTPLGFADYVSERLLRYAIPELLDQHSDLGQRFKSKSIRVLDPACGNGQLLMAFWLQLVRQIHVHGDNRSKLKATEILCGIDLSRTAIEKAKSRLATISSTEQSAAQPALNLLSTNSLFPFNSSTNRGWLRIKKLFEAQDGFDFVIANPPWGADVSSYRRFLDASDLSLAFGQFDTSDLFLEVGLRVTRKGGYLAFILPDSLFSHARSSLRELLLRQTQILYIGRFGEKIFDQVNRGCALIICRNSLPEKNSYTDCFRLSHAARREILSGEKFFREAEDRLSHRVLQRRFKSTPLMSFDIDNTSDDNMSIELLKRRTSVLGEFLTSTRGVELSKHGRIYRCPICGKWIPFPRTINALCKHCGSQIRIVSQQSATIVRKSPQKGYLPLITGESIQRYAIRRLFWIDVKREGINYKNPSIYNPTKIVVRKTGVGITATVDYSGALTNQVVYILTPKDGLSPSIPIEFFLGILNSRAIYYYLSKKYGETEWRTHPYITQQQLLDLPVPSIETLRQNIDQVREVSLKIRIQLQRQGMISAELDSEVEGRIARLYGLKKADYDRIYAMIEAVEDLVPVKALKTVRASDIFFRRRDL